MEWVEVRGDTLDAAKEEALDQLGVARDDAEFEVVQEAESRWMGLKKTEARVRARVRPTKPRPKKESGRGQRRSRGRSGEGRGRSGGRDSKGGGRGNKGRNQSGSRGGQPQDAGQKGSQTSRSKQQGREAPAQQTTQAQSKKQSAGRTGPTPAVSKQGQESRGSGRGSGRGASGNTKETSVNESGQSTTREVVPIEEQHATAIGFLEGVVAGFGLTATVVMGAIDDDTMLASIEGNDLGLMVGPRGGTLYALQDLSRAAMQRMSDGRDTSRLMIDVAGYRERRRSALAEFVKAQAVTVKTDGVELALEPMSSADRKAVHDAVMEIDGIKSISEGEDPRRRVVLLPDS